MGRRKTVTERILLVLLAVVMCFGMLPLDAMAAGTEAPAAADVGEAGFEAGMTARDGEDGLQPETGDIVPEEGTAAPAGGAESAGTVRNRCRMAVLNTARIIEDVPSGAYEVGLEWVGNSKYCTLSKNGTHADLNFEGPTDTSFMNSDGHMNGIYDFKIVLVLHDTDPENFELKIPAVLHSRKYEENDENIYKGWYAEYAIDEASLLRTLTDYEYLSVDVPSGPDKNAENRYYTLHLDAKVSSHAEIPVVVRAYKLSSREERATRALDTYGFFELTDGDSLTVAAEDKAGGTHSITCDIHAGLSGMDANSRTTNRWSGYKGGRIYEWTPAVGKYYGVSRDEFAHDVQNGYVFFEHHYSVGSSGWTEGRLSLHAVPSDSGEVVSMKLAYEAYRDEPVPEKYWSADGADTVYFDVCSPNWGGGMRSRRRSMLTGLVWYGLWGNKLYVNVLVKYPLDAVLDADGKTTNVSCSLEAGLGRGGDAVFTASPTQTYKEPLVNPSVVADGYACVYQGSLRHGRNHLFWLENGVAGCNFNNSLYESHSPGTYPYEGEAVFSTGLLGMSAYDPLTEEWIELGDTDYSFWKMEVERFGVGRPIYDVDGTLVTFDDSDLPDDILDHPISVQYMDNSGSTEWKTLLDSTYRSFLSDVNEAGEKMNGMGIVRLRFVDRDRTVPVDILYRVWTRIGSTSGRMRTLLAHVQEAGAKSLNYETVAFTSATADDGTALCTMGDGVQPDDRIRSMFGRFLGDEGYADESPRFARSRRNIVSTDMDNGVELVPTLYDAGGKAMSPYYDTPVTSHVTAVDWLVLSRAHPLGLHERVNPSELDPPENSILNAEDAVYRILIPDDMDVVSVRSGACDTIRNNWGTIAENPLGNLKFSDYANAINRSSITYKLVENYNATGHTVVLVEAHTPHEEPSMKPCFGGFTIRLQPKNSMFVLNSSNLKLQVAGYAVTKDGKAFASNGNADNGAYFDKNVFADLNGNGDLTELIVSKQSKQCQILYQPTISGTYLSVSDPVTKLSGSSVTVQPEGDYVYRMTYSQMASRSRDVILFDVLEDMEGSAWTGTLKSIDMSDAERQGLDYTVYINTNRLDSQAYVDAKVTEKDLAGGRDGWTVWNGTDGLSGVTAVAVGFGSQEFTKDEAGKPSMVSVRLTMAAPGADGLYKDRNTVRNRSFYSDVLTDGTEQARTVMANIVTVGIDPEELADPYSEFELPKTGGAGTWPYAVLGSTMVLAAGLVLAGRKKRR